MQESKRYRAGDVLDSKDYGKFEVLSVKNSVDITIRFLNSGNVKNVRAGDMLRGFVRDAFEHRLSNAYKIGDTVKTKSSGNVVVVDMLSATKILVRFVDSGFEKFVTGYKVTWWRPNHDRKSSKLFSVSKHGDSLSSTLRAAYLFREGLIERGELLDKIKQGEASID